MAITEYTTWNENFVSILILKREHKIYANGIIRGDVYTNFVLCKLILEWKELSTYPSFIGITRVCSYHTERKTVL